jgi:hypothetical protein
VQYAYSTGGKNVMTKRRESAVWLYVVNLSLLATHEIDSAYWHEWEMFHLPGGIQLFLVANLLLLVLLTYGLTRIVGWERGAQAFSFVVAGAGLCAFAIHAAFMVAGRDEFRSPVSLTLLVCILLVSVSQMALIAPRAGSAGHGMIRGD